MSWIICHFIFVNKLSLTSLSLTRLRRKVKKTATRVFFFFLFWRLFLENIFFCCCCFFCIYFWNTMSCKLQHFLFSRPSSTVAITPWFRKNCLCSTLLSRKSTGSWRLRLEHCRVRMPENEDISFDALHQMATISENVSIFGGSVKRKGVIHEHTSYTVVEVHWRAKQSVIVSKKLTVLTTQGKSVS